MLRDQVILYAQRIVESRSSLFMSIKYYVKEKKMLWLCRPMHGEWLVVMHKYILASLGRRTVAADFSRLCHPRSCFGLMSLDHNNLIYSNSKENKAVHIH